MVSIKVLMMEYMDYRSIGIVIGMIESKHTETNTTYSMSSSLPV